MQCTRKHIQLVHTVKHRENFHVGSFDGKEWDCTGSPSTVYNDGEISTWGDYRGSLSTVYNDGEISTCGEIIEVHSAQSTMMGRSQHVGRL